MLFMNLPSGFGMPDRIFIDTLWHHFDTSMITENCVPTNWSWSRSSNPNCIIHIAIRFWNNFVFMSNNTACHPPLQGSLETPWYRSTTIPNYPMTNAISLFFGPDQPTYTIYYTDLAATPRTSLKSPNSLDPTWPPWRYCISCIATVDNLTNHIGLRPRHWWRRPLNSEADTNHPPMSRCNYTHWALHTMRHIEDGYVNFYTNIRAFFLGFTFQPLPSFTSRTRHGNPRFTIFTDSCENGIQNPFHHVNVVDQVFSRRNIFDHQDIFLPRYWKYFPEQHFLIWIYRIAHGHHRNNGWNKDRRLSTNGNNDGDFQTNFMINGTYIFTFFGKNMNATSNSMQMTVSTVSNASHKKFECLQDMYFAQEIITPTRPSLPARATTTTCWRRPTLKLTFSNSVPWDHWHFETDYAKQQNMNFLEWHNPSSIQKAPYLMPISCPNHPKNLKKPDPLSATCSVGMPN